ncbi:hypothetical protein A7G45_01975 [Mycolicibacterium llatzerense]|uniref:alpha/beta fold hydrolase n=1 Tax=Mycolicibacterium llatzerense TaxID=280871 RepID=UPI0029F7AF2F|nr:hypothetical protein [Mycolicibacterium llatzerense]
MTEAVVKTESGESISMIGGHQVQVSREGSTAGRTVVLLDALPNETSQYQGVLARLQVAKVRTVVIASEGPAAAKAVIGILDALGVQCAVLVGARDDAETAWTTTAHHPERIIGLVVVDRGRAKAPNMTCTICQEHCPPVFTDTTALVSTAAAKSIAQASRRHVHGDFRIAELVSRRGSREFTAQLSTEIILRAFSG